ncbi:MAG: class I SAM-dependent methyltransferase [Anaerolineales bacterium]
MIRRFLHYLASNPRVYDLIQLAAGRKRAYEFLAPTFQELQNQKIVDIAAGTGNLLALIPPSNSYVWLDNDWDKLRGFRQKYPYKAANIGDATRLSYADKSFDVSASLALSHHLTDEQFDMFLREAQRITRSKLIFVDAVASKRWSSRILWTYDRGSFPRSRERILAQIEKYYEIEQIKTGIGLHELMLCVGQPRAE